MKSKVLEKVLNALILTTTAAAFLFVIACDKSKDNIDGSVQAMPENNSVSYYPKPSDKVLTNPYMGLVLNADSDKTYQPFSMVYAGLSWREIEPEKGKYAFEEFEKKYKMNYWSQKGVKFIFRLYMDYPSAEKHMDIPDWLYNEIDGDGIWYNKNGKKGFSPNYRNECLIENHKRLIEALGNRYNDEGKVAFVELGSIGHWGEWHTTYIQNELNAFPTTEITDKYVQHYIDFFDTNKLMMRRPYFIAKDNNFGLYNDAFGDKTQTEDYFLKWIEEGYKDHNVEQIHPDMKDYWKTAPSGGEFANYPGDVYLEDNYIDRTLNMLKSSHTSWLGPSNPANIALSAEKQNNLDRLLKLIGYRFRIEKSEYSKKVIAGKKQNGTITLSNDGVAPFYYDWPMYISIYDYRGINEDKIKVNHDIRNLLPGVNNISYNFNINNNFPAGIYGTKFFIEDPDAKKPSIRFANVSDTEDKTCFIGDFIVQIPNGLSTEDYEKDGWYNYFTYDNNRLTVQGIVNKKMKNGSNNTFVYRNFEAGNKWTSIIKLSDISSSVKDITFSIRGEKDIYDVLTIQPYNKKQFQVKFNGSNESSYEKIDYDSYEKILVFKTNNIIRVYSINVLGIKRLLYVAKLDIKDEHIKAGIDIEFNSNMSECNADIEEFIIN